MISFWAINPLSYGGKLRFKAQLTRRRETKFVMIKPTTQCTYECNAILNWITSSQTKM